MARNTAFSEEAKMRYLSLKGILGKNVAIFVCCAFCDLPYIQDMDVENWEDYVQTIGIAKHFSDGATDFRVAEESEKTKEQFMRDCHNEKHIKQAIENLKKSKSKAIAHSIEKNSKPLAIFNDDFYKEFKNDASACRYLGVHKGSVGRVAKGKTKTIKGYKAKYI